MREEWLLKIIYKESISLEQILTVGTPCPGSYNVEKLPKDVANGRETTEAQ